MYDNIYRFFQGIGYSHPLHPTMVSMPIGLLIATLCLAAFAVASRRGIIDSCAPTCLQLALFFLIPTVLAGLLDWQYFYSGAMLPIIKWKMALAGLLFILLLAALFSGPGSIQSNKPFLFFSGLAFLCVIGLGYLGGNLVFSGRTPPAPQKYAAGREIFRSHCSGCHPYGANAVKARHHLWNSGRLTNILTFTSWIRSPEPPMPPFNADKITEGDAKELLSYLKFALEKEPEH
ncbi:MAG: cytochrome c [Deltaproteobacteria bacterium]